MSYILDALRRADAERERGAVPGLQSQHHSLSGEEEEAAPRSRLLLWIVLGLAALLAAALAWNLFASAAPSRQMAEGSVAPAPQPPPPALIAAAPAVIEPMPAPVPTIASPPVIAPSIAAPPTRSATRAAALAEAETRRAARRSRDEATAANKAAPSTSTTASAQPSSQATSQGEGRVYAMADIPDDVRREIPKLAINGSSYSGDAASRMVMINGQVFHEGDRLTNGLTLEKINRKSAILVFKGWRYELTF